MERLDELKSALSEALKEKEIIVDEITIEKKESIIF